MGARVGRNQEPSRGGSKCFTSAYPSAIVFRRLVLPIPMAAERSGAHQTLARQRTCRFCVGDARLPHECSRPSSDLRRREIPYAINVQCANADFLDSVFLDEFRDAYTGAARVYFVSDDNLKRVEVNLAMALDNAQVIGNPFNVSFDASPQWPDETDGYRLACVARIHFPSKGQDLIIDVMRQDKWRDRNLTVHLYGQSHGNLRQAEDLIAKYGLQEKIYIEGYAQDIEELWSRHHGLLLPSRCEGAALAILEALLCRRVCITLSLIHI